MEASPRSVDFARGCQSFRRTGSSIMMGRGLLWWEFLIIERDIDPPLLVVPSGPDIDQGSCDECRDHVEVGDVVETRETWVRQILEGDESEDYGVADAGESEHDLGGTLLLLQGVLRGR